MDRCAAIFEREELDGFDCGWRQLESVRERREAMCVVVVWTPVEVFAQDIATDTVRAVTG
jgi:hypothetical protein